MPGLSRALPEQSHKNFEVVIVDQNPEGFLDEVVSKYQTALTIKYVRTDPRGVSHARNLGMVHAEGDVVAFPDDDCR